MMIEKELKMQGSIRAFIGFMLVFGAVGGMDQPENSLLLECVLAAIGLALMASGVNAMKGLK
jgi:hypothetical protein